MRDAERRREAFVSARPTLNPFPLPLPPGTTLENAPPEFFIDGDAAHAGWGADTFALGLCVLHALAGAAPYEELMASVHAPTAWAKALAKAWAAPTHGVLRSVAAGDADCIALLADTLWRFAVLIGVPAPRAGAPPPSAVRALLLAAAGREGGDKALAARTRKDVATAFSRDASAWALATGDAPMLARARRRAAAASDGLWPLVSALLSWDAADRPTMRAALEHDAFAGLRVEHAPRADCDEFVFYERRAGDAPIPDV